MKPKIYIETTVVSYLTSRDSPTPLIAGRQQITREWWETRRDLFDLTVSEIVVQEAADGDTEAAKKRLAMLEGIPSLLLSPEVLTLAEALVSSGPIPREWIEDAFHIAIAAVNGVDYLVTWNCKHIANAKLRHDIERIVENYGYACPIICTPEELMED
jgi:predicted nucleic acid-binding protein